MASVSDIPDRDYVYQALLQYNYFPMVKEHRDELPPPFDSEDLTPTIADDLLRQFTIRRGGYDQIEYRVTRFNNVSRLMHIPHPLPYSQLCRNIADNWNRLDYICTNDNSVIKPKRHSTRQLVIMEDYDETWEEEIDLNVGRVVVMDGEEFPLSALNTQGLSLARRYRAEADVASCFPSIYSHAIPWALVGHEFAKNNRGPNEWFNQLDKAQRDLKRGETLGVPIGPGTSNIIAEVILSQVDDALAGQYHFVRFIDDYKCYCETKEQAERFILDLQRELRSYLLEINVRKVKIEELPVATHDSWVIELASRLPQENNPSSRRVAQFLDFAIHLHEEHPEGSVIKYAARSLQRKINVANATVFYSYLVSLAFHYPVVLPILADLANIDSERYDCLRGYDYTDILQEQIRHNRSDAVCWCLYLMGICGHILPDNLADAIINTRDCMAMAMLISLDQHTDKVEEFLDNMNSPNNFDLDQYWILIHELQKTGRVFTNYRNNNGLQFLDTHDVRFIRSINDFIPSFD